MLRSALVVAASATLLFGCKKADSKEVAPSTAADSEMARKGPTDGSAEGGGPGAVKADAAQTGSATGTGTGTQIGDGGKDPGSGKGTAKGTTDVEVAGTPKGSDTTSGDSSYTLTISAPDAVAAGAAATAKLTVKPGKGYHMNKEFPTKLTIEPPAGVTLDKTTFEGDDAAEFDDDHLVFEVGCTPTTSGTYNVSGKLKFAVCTESTCDPKRQAISFAVAAK